MRRLIVIPLLLCFLIAPAPAAQDSSALINEALDKPVNLEIDTALPRAMEAIAKETGVPIEADRSVWELLPWGEQTNVKAKIENRSLREALNAIAVKLGLEAVLMTEAVQLRPMPALMRLGRRSTVQELEALDLLNSNPMGLTTGRPSVKQLVTAVDSKLEELKSPFAIEFRPGDDVKPEQTLSVPRNATMAEALESLVRDTGLTWYPWGDSIVVVPKEAQVRNQLGKTVTLRYNGVDISQVLRELEQYSGVEFSIEPGAVQRVAPEFRNVTLVLDNATIREALESIAGFTGLGYVINANGVYIWNQSSNPGGGGAGGAAAERAIGMILLDNGVQIFLRPADLDPDLLQYLEFRKKREMKKLREMMEEEGFKPVPQAIQPKPVPHAPPDTAPEAPQPKEEPEQEKDL